jgi:hypothetical protein
MSLSVNEKGSPLALPKTSILLLRESGVEFASPKPYELFCEFDLELEVAKERVQTSAVVVGCHRQPEGLWRISLLFERPLKDRENLSLAA